MQMNEQRKKTFIADRQNVTPRLVFSSKIPLDLDICLITPT